MTKPEFDALRNLPDKKITADIAFKDAEPVRPNLTFDQVPVENSLGWDVLLNGTYKPEIPSITFNFVLKGFGPICRVCVNSTLHSSAGRTHRHDLTDEKDAAMNLPNATACPDLDNKTPPEVWATICREGGITHVGTFNDPSVMS